MTLFGTSIIGATRGATGGEVAHGLNAATGEQLDPVFHGATAAEVGQAADLAAAAFPIFSKLSGRERAKFLRTVADKIEALGDALTSRAMAESGLPEASFGVWQAFFAPGTTPDALVARMQAEIAAVLELGGEALVLTHDMLLAGVHFLPEQDPADVAWKLVATNLSDLAAKGADPWGYFLTTSWPTGTTWAEQERFARGLAEAAQLGVALGASAETFMGLSGLGDLVLTATGDLSRNRRVGLLLAQGQTLAQATGSLGHVAEGVYCARTVADRAAHLGVDMPITAAVVALLDGSVKPAQAVAALMARDATREH